MAESAWLVGAAILILLFWLFVYGPNIRKARAPKKRSVPDELEPMSESDVIGVFPRDSAWGNNIIWDVFDNGMGSVYGWKEVPTEGPRWHTDWRPVRNGDLFAYEMESGSIAVFELYEVDNKRDPADMFFAEARAVGVLE